MEICRGLLGKKAINDHEHFKKLKGLGSFDEKAKAKKDGIGIGNFRNQVWRAMKAVISQKRLRMKQEEQRILKRNQWTSRK